MSKFSSEASFNEILICRLLPLNSHLLLLLPFLRVSRHHQTLKVMIIVSFMIFLKIQIRTFLQTDLDIDNNFNT